MKRYLTKINLTLSVMFSITTVWAQTYQWAKSFGGTNMDYSKAIATDGSGNIYTTGYFDGTADFDPGVGTFSLTSYGNWDVYVSKLDALGNFIWAKNFGGTNMEYGNDISVDLSGNVYITGKFGGTVDFDPSVATYTINSAGSNDIFISKFDVNGNFVWAKTIGGTIDDGSNSVTLDASGNVYSIGYYSGVVDFDPGVGTYSLNSLGGIDCFISKLDNNGNFVWAKNIGGTCSEEGLSITIDPTGNICATGRFDCTTDFDPSALTYTLSSAGNDDVFILKLDVNGNFIWAKNIGGTNSDVSFCIASDNGGNIYTTGDYRNTADFDPGVGTYTLTASAITDIFISKLDANGNFVWAKSIGGAGVDVGLSIVTDGIGNSYTTGYFQNIVDFDPSAGIYNLTSGGGGDTFISKLDVSGNFVWAKNISGASSNDGWSIAYDGSGSVCITGVFLGTSDFNPPALANLTSNGGTDIFIAKYNTTTGMSENNFESGLSIYPNPNNGEFKLKIDYQIDNGEILLFNSLGQKVHEQKISHGQNNIITNGLATGLYNFIILRDKGQVSNGKLTVDKN